MSEAIKQQIQELGILVVIPTYNNAGTLAEVVSQVLEYSDQVLVVNDGSTDQTQQIIDSEPRIRSISYSKNRGKGYALKTALRYADEQGFRYAITIDSDGQHYARDIAVFVEEIQKTPDALLVGARNIEAENMPSKNTFANKFSNFWYRLETAQKLTDTQSGFRLYPLHRMRKMSMVAPRYEFELEILVRSVWRGTVVRNVPIDVYYPPQGERISHFRPVRDFARISVMNTFLVIGALFYYYPLLLLRALTWSNIRSFVSRNIIHSPDSNAKLASAMGLGVFFGIVPLWGYQMITAAFVAHLLRVNKVLTVLFANISIPPAIPFIILGSFQMGGWLLDRRVNLDIDKISYETIANDLLQYVVGSFALAAVSGVLMWATAYLLMVIFKRKR